MKTFILACGVFAALSAASCKNSEEAKKEKLKADWVKTCNDGITKATGAASTDDMKKAYAEYCSCTGDKIMAGTTRV